MIVMPSCSERSGNKTLASHDPDEVRVPIVEEQLQVETRPIESDRVRVRTMVDVYDAPVEASVQVGRLEINRVSVDREVVEAPAPYQDGDTLVISVVEERLVVERRLFVVEEVRVIRSSHEETVSASIPLRRTRAVVERDEPSNSQEGVIDGRSQ